MSEVTYNCADFVRNYTSTERALRLNGRSSLNAPLLICRGQEGFTMSERPIATRSNSPRSSRSSKSSIPTINASSLVANDFVNSSLSVTDPTVTVGLPVNFLVQPARLRLLPANSGSQKRRVEQ